MPNLTPQQKKFKDAAVTAHEALRRGDLPRKGDFGQMMSDLMSSRPKRGKGHATSSRLCPGSHKSVRATKGGLVKCAHCAEQFSATARERKQGSATLPAHAHGRF